MAEATVLERSISTFGVRAKVEFILLDNPANGDTVKSHLHVCNFAMPFPVSDDGGDVSCAVGATPTTEKIITIHDPSTTGDVAILAFGN